MNFGELIAKVMDEARNNDDISAEIPGLCGHSDRGKSKGACSKHGHLGLAVAQETAIDLALKETHCAILISVPRQVLRNILDSEKPQEIGSEPTKNSAG